jgi:hypothetical protein
VSDIAQVFPVIFAQRAYVPAFPAHFTVRRQHEAAQHAQKTRLAAAVRACDAQQLAALKREADRAEQRALSAHAFEIHSFEHRSPPSLAKGALCIIQAAPVSFREAHLADIEQ